MGFSLWSMMRGAPAVPQDILGEEIHLQSIPDAAAPNTFKQILASEDGPESEGPSTMHSHPETPLRNGLSGVHPLLSFPKPANHLNGLTTVATQREDTSQSQGDHYSDRTRIPKNVDRTALRDDRHEPVYAEQHVRVNALADRDNKTQAKSSARGNSSNSGNSGIDGSVWQDINLNALVDEDLALFAIGGVPVVLSSVAPDGTASPVETSSSASDGSYSFSNLVAGTYSVSVDGAALAALLQFESIQETTPLNYDVTLSAGEIAGPFNFGMIPVGQPTTASIDGSIWNDINLNGLADEDLSVFGIGGVPVTLSALAPDGSATVVGTTLSMSDGVYSFANLVAGSYRVSVDIADLSAELQQAYDVQETTPLSYDVDTNALNAPINFGVFRVKIPGTATIEGSVWEDLNNNGILDEPLPLFSIVGAPVTLSAIAADGSTNATQTTLSASDGSYSFAELVPGAYRVSVQLDDLEVLLSQPMIQTTTFAYEVNASAGDVAGPFNFGAGIGEGMPDPIDAKVTVWIDLTNDGLVANENLATTGLANIRIQVLSTSSAPREFFTDAMGCVVIPLLPNQEYLVELDESTVPEVLDLRSTPTSQAIGLNGLPVEVNFGVFRPGIAIELESVEVEDDTVHWTTAWEQDVLGYRVYQRDLDATEQAWTLLNPALVLAQGGGAYQLPRHASHASAPVIFSLREVTTNLTESEIARFADASPQGAGLEPISIGRSGQIITVPVGGGSILVEPAARIEDADDPELELLGEVIETASGSGIYFSWPEGRRVRVR